MVVYVLVNTWQYKSGEQGQFVKVYKNLQTAKEEAKLFFKSALESLKVNCPDVTLESKSKDNLFSVWEKGNYIGNHETIIIHESEINEK